MAAEALEDICALIVDCPHKTAPTSDDVFAYAVGTTAIAPDGTISFDKARGVDAATFGAWTTRAVPRQGDLIFCREAPVGPVALVPPSPRVCLGQRTMLLRPDLSRADPRWLAYTLRAPTTLAALLALSEGSTVAHLNVSDVRRFELDVPSLHEQRAVASVLGAFEDNIASSRRLADAADAVWLASTAPVFAAAREVAVSALIADGVLVVNDGYRAKNSELAANGIPFLRAGNLTNDGLVFDDADLVPPEVAVRAGIKIAVGWDTAFTSKGTVGRITLVGPDPSSFVYSPQVCFWRSADHDLLSPFVIHAWMRSARFKAQVDAVKGQTDMADYVSLGDQRAMRFDLPLPGVQREVSAFAEPLARLAAAHRGEARTLTAIRDALLPKLVSGQIRVPLSDDREGAVGAAVDALEPATV